MIKTTVTLACDHCGREIRKGEKYYVEQVELFHRLWDGAEEQMIPDEEVECEEHDLCEECYAMIHGCVAEQLPVAETEVAEQPVIAEDVEIGETVELDDKTYTEYQPETGDKVETTVTRNEEKGTATIERTITTTDPEPAPETREIAARIIAMGRKPKKRLTDAQREQIVQMMQDGVTMDKVAKAVGCSAQTVCNVWHKHNTNQEVQDGR